MDATERAYEAVVAALRSMRRGLVLLACAGSLLHSAAVGVAILLAGVLLEALFYLPAAGRATIGLLVLAGPLALLAFALVRKLPTFLTLHRLGLHVEERCPRLQQRLISTLELWRDQRARTIYSLDLLALTVTRTADLLGRVQTREIADLKPVTKSGAQPRHRAFRHRCRIRSDDVSASGGAAPDISPPHAFPQATAYGH